MMFADTLINTRATMNSMPKRILKMIFCLLILDYTLALRSSKGEVIMYWGKVSPIINVLGGIFISFEIAISNFERVRI